jgi:hypothetical protein
VTAADLGPSPTTARDELLDRAAVDGLDVDAARTRADQLARGRRRTLRGALGAVGVLALVGIAAFAFLGDDDPDELVADRVEPTTTSSSTSTTSAPTTSAPAPAPIAPTTLAPTTTLAPSTTTTTTTIPPNQPIVAEFRPVAGRVEAGQLAAVEVAWVDPDHAGAEPDVSVDWGDPAVSALDLPTPATRCDAPGSSGAGVLRREFRFATPGERRVRITLTTCGGDGAYAERTTVEGTVSVAAPTLDGLPATAVVVVAPRTANGLPVLPSLDDAEAVFEPSDTTVAEQALGARTPPLLQYATAGPATVLVLPGGAVGTVRLTWPASSCASTTSVDLGAPSTGAPVLALDSSC